MEFNSFEILNVLLSSLEGKKNCGEASCIVLPGTIRKYFADSIHVFSM